MKDTKFFLQRSSEQLGNLYEHAKMLQILDQQLQKQLPEASLGHVHIANLNSDTLVILTDSASWATQLRYRSKTLLQDLLPFLPVPPPHSIQIITRPMDKPAKSAPVTQTRLSRTAAENLRSAAASIDTPALKKALQNLADNEQDR